MFYDIILSNKIALGSKHRVAIKVWVLLKIFTLPLSSCVIFQSYLNSLRLSFLVSKMG